MSKLPKDFGPEHPDWVMPSKRNRYFLEKRTVHLEEKKKLLTRMYEEERLCITTMVSGPYQWYAPLFVYCARKEYPEYDIKVLLRGDNVLKDVPEVWDGCQDSIIGHYDPYDKEDGYLTAAMRHLVGDKYFGNYDYVIIMDVDTLIQRETPSMQEQHLSSMERHGLDCYDNYTVSSHEGSPILPGGGHFVTREWWSRTQAVRKKYLDKISQGPVSIQTDERTLGAVITESGLKAPPTHQNLWSTHGIHLGYYRVKLSQKRTIHTDATHQVYTERLLKDENFMKLVDQCGTRLPEIIEIFDVLRGK